MDNYRKICNGCKKYPRTILGYAKQLKIRKETVEAFINRAINEGYIKRTERGSIISR